MDIYAAAAAGELEQVQRQLYRAAGLGVNIVNCIDESGRTASFLAQLRGHDKVVSLLAAHGWTTMEDANLFTIGGRVCFWHEPKFPRHLCPMPAPMRSADVRPRVPPARSMKKARVAERRAARSAVARARHAPLAPTASAFKVSLRPCLVADDMSELGLITTRVFGGKTLASRLKTGASAIVTSAWRSSQNSSDWEDDPSPAWSCSGQDAQYMETWPQVVSSPDESGSEAEWELVQREPCESGSEEEWELVQ
ncbi:hypothetical protein T492DRAFT_946120 [Pavlovales sp. CCMP2436]|nr:hypothetical protein T492DRAFT_946120 [Pavlovales sp. CCMP2436]